MNFDKNIFELPTFDTYVTECGTCTCRTSVPDCDGWNSGELPGSVGVNAHAVRIGGDVSYD